MRDKNKDVFKVKVTENGPYIITGGIPLSRQIICTNKEGFSYEWREEESYPLKDKYSLCRCGNTKSKPFCDGSHFKIKLDAPRLPVVSHI